MCHPGGPLYQAAAARRAARSSSTAAAALSAWRLRSPSPRPASRFHVTPFLLFEAALQPQPDRLDVCMRGGSCGAICNAYVRKSYFGSLITYEVSRMPLGALLGASTGMKREGSRMIRITIAVPGFAAGQDCCVTWIKRAREYFIQVRCIGGGAASCHESAWAHSSTVGTCSARQRSSAESLNSTKLSLIPILVSRGNLRFCCLLGLSAVAAPALGLGTCDAASNGSGIW